MAAVVDWWPQLQAIAPLFADVVEEVECKICGTICVLDTNRCGILRRILQGYCIADDSEVEVGHAAPAAAQEQLECISSNLLGRRINDFKISPHWRKAKVGIVQDQMQELLFNLQSLQCFELASTSWVAYLCCHLVNCLHSFGIVTNKTSNVDGTSCRMPFEVGGKKI